MLMSWTHREHTTKRQPCAGMRAVCLRAGLSLSAVPLGVNRFSGRLGQTKSIDSRYTRH
jgi:hypothetical protein